LIRYIIIVVLSTLVITSLHAQTPHPLTLTVHRKLHHIHQLPFDKVIVFDNRLDIQKIGSDQNGSSSHLIWRFDSTTTSLAIKTYIETAIRKFPKESGVLYISLKQLQIVTALNEVPKFYFSADAYFKKNNTFRKIGLIKKEGILWVSPERTIRRALNNLIEKVNYNYYNYQNIDSTTYVFDDIANWMNYYPIMRQSVYLTNGVYESINDFRNNKIKPINLSMKIGSDSVYAVSFSEGNKYYNESLDYYRNIFVICYNRCLYIKIDNKHFLPLSKINNKFCFNVPLSLPNMPAIIAEKNLPYPSAPGDTGAPGIGGAIGGIIIDAATKSHREKVYNQEKQDIISQGLEDRGMRNCFIDIGTGGITYY
jgi:hypothetical protein